MSQAMAQLEEGPSLKEQLDEGLSLKGLTPENWLCIDCGLNTAPGFKSRVELEAAFAAGDDGVSMHINAQSEVYTVRNRIWSEAGMEPYGGCLCIGCLEKRLGRRLTPKDFQRGHSFNHPAIPGTPRLLKRRGVPQSRARHRHHLSAGDS